MKMRLTLGAAALLIGGLAQAANTPGALDLPPSNVVPAPVDILNAPARPAPPPAEPGGNPLWAIPLSTLTATRDRPLFTPSRRPAAPAVAAIPAAAPAPPPTTPEEERPPLILVGAIASETEGFAVFLDQTSNQVVRLRIGQDHNGWVLRTVKGREVTLQKDKREATLTLPLPGTAANGPALGMPQPVPAAATPNAPPKASVPMGAPGGPPAATTTGSSGLPPLPNGEPQL
jgi:general secretion pathway protein N